MRLALRAFKEFLKVKYPVFEHNIKPEQISKDMIVAFVEYEQNRRKGEGARSLYKRFSNEK
jgi:hypothetical protein